MPRPRCDMRPAPVDGMRLFVFAEHEVANHPDEHTHDRADPSESPAREVRNYEHYDYRRDAYDSPKLSELLFAHG